MKVQVAPSVEYGTNRGGEDFYLNFRAFHEGQEPPVAEEIVVELAIGDDCPGVKVEQQGLDELEPGGPGDTDEPFAVGVSVRYCTYDYDFEWTGNGTDVLPLSVFHKDKPTVEAYLRDRSNWRFCHKPGETPKLVCEGQVYVDGNAD